MIRLQDVPFLLASPFQHTGRLLICIVCRDVAAGLSIVPPAFQVDNDDVSRLL